MSRWKAALSAYSDVRLLVVVILGVASGLPSPLLAANLSIWLTDEGLTRTSVAAFGMVAAPYAVNFLWAPVFDRVSPPGFRRLGQRRGWLLLLLLLLISAILILAEQNPQTGLMAMGFVAFTVAVSSASLDVVVDAFRIESLDESRVAAGSAASILGWHLGGTVIGGAGGLLLAARWGWPMAYWVLAGVLVLPAGLVLVIREPQVPRHRALGPGGWASLWAALIEPLRRLTQRPLWVQMLLFIIVFKLGDAMLGRMSGVFYREVGFDYETIAEVSKLYGIAATLTGSLIGGMMLRGVGVGRGLLLAGVAMAVTNLLFCGLAQHPDRSWFIAAVIGDGLTSGLAVVAFVAFLSRLCDPGHAATQYAVLASIGNFSRIMMAGAGGWMVDRLGGDWQTFFVLTALMALPGLGLLTNLLLKTRMGDGVFSHTNRKNR